MPMYSHSRLSVYEICPRRYRFQYLERVKVPEVETVELFLGRRVHEALETLYRRVKAGSVPSLDEVLADYRARWHAQWTDAIRVGKPERTADDYLAAGVQHLETYHARYQPFDQERTVGLERRIAFALDAGRKIWVRGYIDRLSVTRDGIWQIRDYKSGRWLPTQADVDQDRQLALYQIGIQRHFRSKPRPVELVWHYLAHDVELRSQRAPEALRALESETLGLIDTIQADKRWEMVEGPHCRRCSYQPICPAWSPQLRLPGI